MSFRRLIGNTPARHLDTQKHADNRYSTSRTVTTAG